MYRAFFSFDYIDFNNASIVHNACRFKRAAQTFLIDESVWNEAVGKGEAHTKKLIEKGIIFSDVAIFLVGAKTFQSKWVQFAFEVSRAKQKGILGIYLPNQMAEGPVNWLTNKGISVYHWDSNNISNWIETAAKKPVH